MLSQWRIRVHKNYPLAAPVMADDTTKYVEWGSSGAVTALLVEAQPMKNGKEVGKPIIDGSPAVATSSPSKSSSSRRT